MEASPSCQSLTDADKGRMLLLCTEALMTRRRANILAARAQLGDPRAMGELADDFYRAPVLSSRRARTRILAILRQLSAIGASARRLRALWEIVERLEENL